MIENLIHTVNIENKPSKYGSLQGELSKTENNLEGRFRALFKSYNSEPENSENSQSDQDPTIDTDETKIEVNGSSDAANGIGIGSGAVINVEDEELITQNSKDQKSENQHENRDPAKITVIDASIVETENSQNLVEQGSAENNANVSESNDQEVPGGSYSNSKNEHTEIQELSKVSTVSETAIENNLPVNAQLLEGLNSANEKSSSENSTIDLIRRGSITDLKESLSDSVLKTGGSSSEKSEAENKVDTNAGGYASKIQDFIETDSQNESKVTVSTGSDKPVQKVENPTANQAAPAGHIAKGEPEVLISNEIRRFLHVEDDSNTIRKSGVETGKAWQSDGLTNQLNNPVKSNEPVVLQSDEEVQVKVKENSSSAGLINNEVYSEKNQSGESGSTRVQPSVRESNENYTFTTFTNRAILNHGENPNHSETRQLAESPENVSDRIINENIEKPMRIAQKAVESTVLIQDKIHPKRERNNELFLNNELTESSRLTIPGIGADATKQNTSFSSGQNSEDFGGLSESGKNELLWKEHITESVESDEMKRTELSAEALTKLGDSTLSNHFLRRVLLPGLTQTVFTASSQSNRAESWQRHNFILEDGSKVQLSARKIDGVLQIKLGATIGELSKLMQIHQDEIREHLEKECNIKIDLQFEQGSGEQDQSSLENFFGQSTKKPVFEGGVENESRAKSKIKKQLQAVVTRNFGYNSKEWTA